MKKNSTLAAIAVLLYCVRAFSQTTETFETETANATSFTDNGQVFNITSQSHGPFSIQASYPGTGWNGTAADNRYIDNDAFAVANTGIEFTISSSGAVAFTVKKLYLYLSDHNANNNVAGTLTLTGILGGVTKFTAVASTGFNTGVSANGFSLIDMTVFGGSNNSTVNIDQLDIKTTSQFSYVALDAFTWQVAAVAPSITGQPANSSICAGNTSFTVGASNATGYQWQVNTGSGFTNITNGGIYSNATTATLNLTGATTSNNGYLYRCVVSGAVAPNATSNGATLTVSTTGKWLGAVSTAWSNTANWGCGTLPIATTLVSIPAGTPFSPTVDITTATCKDLGISPGATLTISSGNALAITGTVYDTGTVVFNGKVILSGNGITIPALTYTDLEIAGTGAAKPLGGNVTVNGVLTLTNTLVRLSNFDLTIGNSGSINGGSATSYFIANSSGVLRINNIGTGGRTTSVVFPIGPSNGSYTPLSLVNTGTPDQFAARASIGVNSSYTAGDVPNGSGQTSLNVNETWYVYEAVAGGSAATLTFQWNATDEQSGFDRSHCFGAHFTGGHWTHGSLNLAASGSNPYSVSLTGVTSFSPFGVGSTGSILPVHLISFTGKRENSNILLNWQADNEQNLRDYIIEASANGVDSFTANGTVAALNQPGVHDYSFTVKDASSKAMYYRLKQTDADGGYTYSSVIRVNAVGNNERTILYPNPVIDKAVLSFSLAVPSKLTFRIINSTGKVVQTWQHILPNGPATENINLSSQPRGVYYLEIKGNGYHERVKMVRE